VRDASAWLTALGDGTVAGWILLAAGLEALVLLGLLWRRRRFRVAASMATTLVAGLLLLAALWASQIGADPRLIAAALAAAGLAHVVDVVVRLRTDH
jgi:hypothetical protein